MKRIALFAALLLAVVSCTPELDQNQNPENPAEQTKVVFHATFADPSAPDTKVFLNDEWKLRWNEGDAITVFNRNDQNQAFNATVKQDGAAADFTPASGDGVGSGNAVSHIYAVYPYQSAATISSSGALSLTLPAQQAYYGGNSFGQGANTMVSVTDDENLVFKNAGAFLELKLYGTDVKVKRISLTGKSNEKLAGVATVTVDASGIPSVSMSDSNTSTTVEMVCTNPVALGSSQNDYTSFVLVIPPTTFTKGFTITVEDNQGGVFAKTTTKSVTIDRNKVVSMAPIQVEPYAPVWGVVGAFNDWGGPASGPKTDLVMTKTAEGVWVSPAFKVPAGNASGDGFKLRKDYVWTIVNYGGTFTGFGQEFDVFRDGANIQLSNSQDYMVKVTLYAPETGTTKVQVDKVDVWSVTGYFNGWQGDLEMTETSAGSGIWESPIFDSHPSSGYGDNGFKLRKNYSFNEGDYGGTFSQYGTAFTADPNGANVIVDNTSANHRISVRLDLSVTPAKITVYEHPVVWSVMGDFNNWSADLDMTETETGSGIWVSPVFETRPMTSGNGFKFRKNHDYEQGKYYGDFLGNGYGVAFNAVAGDGNITLGDYTYQNYRVSAKLDLSDAANPKITVYDHNVWSICGSFDGWTDDVEMEKIGTYQFKGVLTDIPVGTTFKIRKNYNWDYNWGAFNQETTITPGQPLSLNSKGSNIRIAEAGTYEVVLNLENTMTVTVTKVQP